MKELLQEYTVAPEAITANELVQNGHAQKPVEQKRPPTPNNFYVLRQDGIMRTPESVVFGQPISHNEWRSVSPTEKAKVRSAKNEAQQILGVAGMKEVQDLLKDKDEQKRRSAETYKRLGKMYNIEGSEREVVEKIDSFGEIANSVNNMLVNDVLPRNITELGMVNKIQATNNPFELALIMFDDRYDQRARFEAKKKLIKMNLAGATDQRERETNIRQNFEEFNDFLEQHVWAPDVKIGATDQVFLYSSHDPNTLECQRVEVLTPEQRQNISLGDWQRITPVRRRKFRMGGRDIPIYATLREKSAERKILKLLRKGKENPAVAVDDELGLMGVLDNTRDAVLFAEHLGKSAIRAGSMLTFEEVENTLDGGKHEPKSVGSSPDVQMFKFHARWNGMRTENLLLTNKLFLDYQLRTGVAHDEFEMKRLFESGVINLLFPTDIYGYDYAELEEAAMTKVRKQLRNSF